MKKRMWVLPLIVISIVCILLAGCSSAATGLLEFRANGEDFVRQGFVSKDGWAISFQHLYVCLDDITAYQTDPAYDATVGEIDEDSVEVQEVLSGSPETIDLAAGGENADPILVGELDDAKEGYYNAIYWEMVRATSGDAQGYSIVMIGTAQKDGEDDISFTISIETEYSYSGGEYVGEETKGEVVEDGTADIEMTFHFDHIFGDDEAEDTDHINTGSVGFQPFANIAVDNVVDVDMAELNSNSGFSSDDYDTLVEALTTLGHVGEGHCHCVSV